MSCQGGLSQCQGVLWHVTDMFGSIHGDYAGSAGSAGGVYARDEREHDRLQALLSKGRNLGQEQMDEEWNQLPTPHSLMHHVTPPQPRDSHCVCVSPSPRRSVSIHFQLPLSHQPLHPIDTCGILQSKSRQSALGNARDVTRLLTLRRAATARSTQSTKHVAT